MSENITLVASYTSHNLARAALRKLQNKGVDMSKLVVVAKGDDKSQTGATVVGGLGDIGAESFGCIPSPSIPDYEAELNADRMLLVAHGTADEIAQVRSVIDLSHPDGWDGSVGCAIYYGCID